LSSAIEMMKKREQEIQRTILHLSEKTKSFTNPELIVIGGYALRAFVSFSRFTRDCDFALKKKNGWNIDELKIILPEDYSIEEEEKRGSYGFLRCVKFVKYDKTRVKVSLDFMEGEIRGRKTNEIILIDELMVKGRRFFSIQIVDQAVTIAVPDYPDYFIMKVVSSRASDIRDIASLIHKNGIPLGLEKRIKQILPNPEIFKSKIKERILPEIRRATFVDSWRGIFGTTKYTEEHKRKVLEQLEGYIEVAEK